MNETIREAVINKEALIFAEDYSFKEELNNDGNTRSFKMIVNALPLNQISSNGVLYNEQSVRDTLKDWEGAPFCDNHNVDLPIRQAPPFGHVEKAWIDENKKMMMAQVDIDPAEDMFIRKAKRKDIGKVSIQVLGGKVMERYDEATGKPYTEAHVGRVLELSSVLVPGFSNATMQSFESVIAESLGKGIREKKEDVTTVTGAGAIGPAKLPGADYDDDDKEMIENLNKAFKGFPMVEFHMGLLSEMKEHPEVTPLDAAQLVIDHLKENPNYYAKDKSEEAKQAESLVHKFGEDKIKEILKDI